MLRSITVYCSSSKHVAPIYFDAARRLGALIAQSGWTLVYGGNRVGSMGALADAARAARGKVVGITPRLLFDKGIGDELCDELILTDDMRQRKALLDERGDAFVVLPGGVGTFEEMFEILVGRTLGYHNKPIVLLNINGYYDPLLTMMEHGLREKFIRDGTGALWEVCRDVEAAVEYLKRVRPEVLAPAPEIVPPPSAIE